MKRQRTVSAPPAPTQRGAALLLAMIVMALVTTVVGAMTWHQQRAVDVEGAERVRAQAAWILHGALDWTRMILRADLQENRRQNKLYDGLDEPWATPLAEVPLSSFLAADKNNNSSADAGPQAFVSGRIEDAQSRFNLRSLVDDAGKPMPEQVKALERLCTLAGLPGDTATRLAQAVATSLLAAGGADPAAGAAAGSVASTATAVPAAANATAALAPQRLADVAWSGLEPRSLAALERWVDVLPARTPINVNTAPREALLAAIDGIDLATAQRLVAARQRQPFVTMEQLQTSLPPGTRIDPTRAAMNSAFFRASIRLRIGDVVVQERSLLLRTDDRVDVIKRDKRNTLLSER